MNSQKESREYRAVEVSVEHDLSALSFFLYRQGIPHKVTEEAGVQVIWTVDPSLVTKIQQLYNDWRSGLLQLEPAPRRKSVSLRELSSKVSWRKYPITLVFLAACVLVAVISEFGQSISLVSNLSFVPFKFVPDSSGGSLYFSSLSTAMEQGQYWRLITPVFLHFNLLHLVFNMLWLFDIGKRIEARQGGGHLVLLILTTGLVSNFVQYFWGGGAALFGGFSGVIYGLLGYCMLRERLDKTCRFGILPAIYGFMLFFLAIGYTGVLDVMLGGSIANAAHTGGLLAGALIGGLAGILLKPKAY